MVLFSVFLAPTVMHIQLGRAAKSTLLGVAGALVAYGIILTVVPNVWTPFAAKYTMPKIGWFGVFTVAIVCDAVAAILAFFVLRRMKAPAVREVAAVATTDAGAASAARA
jgi:hypothetical protein